MPAPPSAPPLPSVDSAKFKQTLASFPSGVTVVTTRDASGPSGMTVSAFCSVSLEPPRVLVCLGNNTSSKPVVEAAGCYAVHILGRDGCDLAKRFAKLLPDISDPFEGLRSRSAVTGAPILEGAIAWLDCSVVESYPVGDHTLFIGAVRAVEQVDERTEPLLYFQRAFRSLADESVG